MTTDGRILAKYAITTIDTKKEGNMHYFDGSYEANPMDQDAIVLKNIQKLQFSTGQQPYTYVGEEVTAEEAGEQIAAFIAARSATPNMISNDVKETKVMLIIHGNTVQPKDWLETALPMAQKGMPSYLVVPVIWPTHSSNYNKNWRHAPQAGFAFRSAAKLVKVLTNRKPFNLLCHSLGNRFLCGMLGDGTLPDLNIDQIFMVAADIWDETFNERVVRGQDGPKEDLKKRVGLHILNQARKNVHILHSRNDYALILSRNVNGPGRRRVGQFGSFEQTFHSGVNRLCLEATDKIIDHNMQAFEGTAHSYHFGQRACRIYENYMAMDCTPKDIFKNRTYYIQSVTHGTYLRALGHGFWRAPEVDAAINRDSKCKFELIKTGENGVKGTKFKFFSRTVGAYMHFLRFNDVDMRTPNNTGKDGWFTIRKVPPKLENVSIPNGNKDKYVIVGMRNGNHLTLKSNKEANQQYHHASWEEYYIIQA